MPHLSGEILETNKNTPPAGIVAPASDGGHQNDIGMPPSSHKGGRQEAASPGHKS